MKYFKTKNILVAVLLILMSVACILSVKFMTKTAGAKTEDTVESTADFKSFCGNAYEERSNVNLFLSNGYIASYDDLDYCKSYGSDTHGDARENGGTHLLNYGCRNYAGFIDKYTYGTTDIPYWINQKKLANFTSTKQKNLIARHIRSQAEMWNEASMYSIGNFVNFYEVVTDIKPSDINGRKVIEIIPEYYDKNKNDGIYGHYDMDNCVINLYYSFSNDIMTSPYKTVAHEFGHVLGLADLDTKYNQQHRCLMGYSDVSTDNLDSIIHYQDIQGVASINNCHTCSNSSLMRYVKDGSNYQHICFYCDRVFIDQNIISGSKTIEDETTCSHEYKQIVSCGAKRWEKCTKCYKVKEVTQQEQNGCNISLTAAGNAVTCRNINAVGGNAMPSFDMFAPKKDGWVFDGYYDAIGNKYYEMRVENDPQTAQINGWDTAYVEKVFPMSGVIWPYRANTTLYANWIPMNCNYTYNNVGDGNYLTPTTVHLIHGNVTFNASNIDGYDFQHFTYEGKEYSSPATINIKLYRDYNGNIRPSGTLVGIYKKHEDDSCLATGSLITLADGSQVAVENLTGNEMLLVWNLYTGAYDTAPILFIDKDPLSVYKVINLTFSDGTTVKVISEHGFWDYNLNKYVYIDENNADSFIGHWFNKGQEKIQLKGVEIKEEQTAAYSPVTAGHLCYFVNGMLSMPGGIDGLFNIFDVDAETMKYDEVSMQLDIESYGLFTYEEFITYLNLPEEVFEAFNAQYLK